MFLGLAIGLVAAAFAGDDPVDAAAPASDWSLVLAGGLGGAAGPPSLQGHGVGRLTLMLGRVGLAFAGREGVATADLRTVGGIFAGAQLSLGERTYLRGGFAHHHETPWAAFTASPAGSFAGVSEGIVHRSGFELGAGLLAPLGPSLGWGDWLGVALDGSVVVLPDPGGPPVYGMVEFLFTVRAH